MMKANVRVMSHKNSRNLCNGLYNRALHLVRLFIEKLLQESLCKADNLLKSADQTGFVYLFMPRLRHVPG